MANQIQIKRSTVTRTPTANFGEQAYTTNGSILWIGQDAANTSNVIAIGGARFPGVLTANQSIVTDANSWVNALQTGLLIIGTDGVATQNITSISYLANSTQLGASAAGSNNEIVPSWGIKTYVDGKVAAAAGTPAGANTYVQFDDSGSFGGTAGLVFDKTSNTLTVANTISVPNVVGTTHNITANVAITDTTFTVTSNTQAYKANSTVTGLQITGNTTATYVLVGVGAGVTNVVSTTTNLAGTTLAVSSNATFSGANVLISSTNTAVTGSVTFSGTALNSSANATFSGANVLITSTNTNIASNVTVTGTAHTYTGTVLFNSDVTMAGNLTINGTATTINVATVTVTDSLIKLASNNGTSNTIDIGLYGVYGNSTVTSYSGIFRDTSNGGIYTLFQGLSLEPATTVDTSNTSFTRASMLANFVTEVFTANSTKVNITAGSMTTTLTVPDGGTGAAGFANNGVLYGQNTSALAVAAAGVTGTVLQINGSGVPAFATLDGGVF